MFRIEDAGSGDRLPAAGEPTIGITMPMTEKPVRRDRYPVESEQKNEIGRVGCPIGQVGARIACGVLICRLAPRPFGKQGNVGQDIRIMADNRRLRHP